MTSTEMLSIENTLIYLTARNTYVNYTKTKTEFIINIPGNKFPGVYIKIPFVGKFTVQVYFPKGNLADFSKVSKTGFKTRGKANYKTIYLHESPTVPFLLPDIAKILINAKTNLKTIKII